jgi:xanthine dehydrogenase YagS FAD-binding subunit
VAMAALHAEIEVQTPAGVSRNLPIAELHRLPGGNPERDTNLARGELITAVILPPPPAGKQVYRKVRDRASYAFALVSVAAIVDATAGRVRDARLALGGVAHKPWMPRDAERELVGAPAQSDSYETAARAALRGAQPHAHNEFKVPLTERLIADTLGELARSGG